MNKVMECAKKLMIPDLNETVEQYFKVGEAVWPVDMILEKKSKLQKFSHQGSQCVWAE